MKNIHSLTNHLVYVQCTGKKKQLLYFFPAKSAERTDLFIRNFLMCQTFTVIFCRAIRSVLVHIRQMFSIFIIILRSPNSCLWFIFFLILKCNCVNALLVLYGVYYLLSNQERSASQPSRRRRPSVILSHRSLEAERTYSVSSPVP